jgi:hypothetical protein
MLSHHDGMAVIGLDSPPVNTLSHELRSRIMEEIDAPAVDPTVCGIALAGNQKSILRRRRSDRVRHAKTTAGTDRAFDIGVSRVAVNRWWRQSVVWRWVVVWHSLWLATRASRWQQRISD